MATHAQHMPPLMPSVPPPPPPTGPTPSGGVAASSWQQQPPPSGSGGYPSPSRGHLDLPSSRRNSGRISADEADDHFTDVDSLYGDPNAPSSNHHQQRPDLSSYPLAAAPTLASSTEPNNHNLTVAPRTRIIPDRQASFSSIASSSAASSSASPRQSAESPSSPTFGAARPFSVSSSIWAGKGALHPSTAANRKRAAPMPPMPPLPPAMAATGSHGGINGSSSAASSNPASPLFPQTGPSSRSPALPANSPHSMPSPLLSEDFNNSAPRHSFESGSMYSYMDDDTRAGHGASPRGTMDWRSADARGFLPDGTTLPPMPPLPLAPGGPLGSPLPSSSSSSAALPDAAAIAPPRKDSIPTINKPGPTGFAEGTAQRPSNRSGLRPPPMPTSRRQVLSYEEAEAQEEQELSALQREEDLVGGPAANKRLSTMGPKLKKNSPAPWELGGEDDDEPFSAGSGGGGPGGGGGGASSFNPFSKRPSTDGRDSADVRRPPLPAKDSFGSGGGSGGGGGGASSFFSRPSRDLGTRQPQHAPEPFPPSLAVGLESENTDASGIRSSLGESSNASGTRSRTKSISSAAAAGVLKGLGLGSSASGGPMQGSSMNGMPSPGSAPSSVGKKSKLAKALRLGNSHHHAGPPPSSYLGLDARGPISSSSPMYAQKSSDSRLSQEDGPAPPLSSMSAATSRSSAGADSAQHSSASLLQQQQLQQQAQNSLQQSARSNSSSHSAGQNASSTAAAAVVSGAASASAPQSPISYSPHSAASPSLPPLMSHSQSSVLRQSDDVMMSPTSATGGQRSSSSTTAHTSLSTGGGGSATAGTNGPGLKALLLQPRPPVSSRRQGTGDGFGGAGGPLGPFPAAPSTPTMGSVTDGSEEDWRKPLMLSPRTTSLGMSPGGEGRPGMGNPASVSMAANNRARMPTSPTATRLGSISANNPSSNMPASDTIQTITETTQNLSMSTGPGSRGVSSSAQTAAAAGAGLDRYASPPPSGAAITGPTALGLTPSTSGIEPNSDEHGGAAPGGEAAFPPNYPRPGQAEGVPYKLISLEQARANQAREREERNARSAKAKGAPGAGGMSASGSNHGASGGGAGGGGMPTGPMGRSQSIPGGGGGGGANFTSSSSQGHGGSGGITSSNQEEYMADHAHGPSSGGHGGGGGGFGVKALKNKKSGGFLRMFNKDRAGSDPHAPPVPSFAANSGGVGIGGGVGSQRHESGEEGRYVSAGGGEDDGSRLGTTGYGKGSISNPPTPKFTVSRETPSVRGSDSVSRGLGAAPGGAISGGLAPLGGGQGGGGGGLSLSAPALKLRPMSSMMAGFADLLDPSLTEDPLPAVSTPAATSTLSAPSAPVATSSSSTVLAPASPSGVTKSPPLLSPVEATTHSNSRSTSMTSFTSAGAPSDDAKVAGRSGNATGVGAGGPLGAGAGANNSPAVDMGGSGRLVASSRSTSISAATASDGTVKTTLRVDPAVTAAGGGTAMAASPRSASSGSNEAAAAAVNSAVIPPCAMCGCTCGEQRRQQALNAAAVLEGVSVLDRGRAIKPGMNQSSKFGSYALR
ncbi:hypothetical protein OC846_004914 [Tilletia horrida]|uniref:Uncharacterized protein n=1 Tax=Tilletia horrida TaxID=155126 RepID=A0AAN6GNY2_9BASI|nr:hypothetical protein OC846_004914 [Tilletia horrida]